MANVLKRLCHFYKEVMRRLGCDKSGKLGREASNRIRNVSRCAIKIAWCGCASVNNQRIGNTRGCPYHSPINSVDLSLHQPQVLFAFLCEDGIPGNRFVLVCYLYGSCTEPCSLLYFSIGVLLYIEHVYVPGGSA